MNTIAGNIAVLRIVVLGVLLPLDAVTLIPFSLTSSSVLRLEKTVRFFSGCRVIVNPFCLLDENKLNYYSSSDITMPRSITVIYCVWIIEVFSSECLAE